MTPGAPALSAARPADAPALAALHALAFPPGAAWGAEAIAIMLGLPGGFGLWRPGEGFVLARAAGGEAEVLTLAIAPAARRRGLGRALVARALALAIAPGGADAAFLEVAEDNAAALALYRGCGFREVGRRPRYYADGTAALVMRRDLP